MSLELARNWVFDVLVNSSPLGNHVGNRILQAGSIGVDPQVAKERTKPFLIYRAGLVTPLEIPGKRLYPFYFYVHDDRGSYLTHIEPALSAIESAFSSRAPEVWNGRQFFAANWQEFSEDLYDDMLGTATRYATINVTT